MHGSHPRHFLVLTKCTVNDTYSNDKDSGREGAEMTKDSYGGQELFHVRVGV